MLFLVNIRLTTIRSYNKYQNNSNSYRLFTEILNQEME